MNLQSSCLFAQRIHMRVGKLKSFESKVTSFFFFLFLKPEMIILVPQPDDTFTSGDREARLGASLRSQFPWRLAQVTFQHLFLT